MSTTHMTTQRKSILKKQPTGKFQMRDFQRDDIAYMDEVPGGSANWSTMGCFKTSTVEWLLELKTKHIPNPRVLIITTKTGKGPYMESLWEVLPEWDIYNVDPKGVSLIIGSRKVPRLNLELPDPLYMRPVIVLAHYHCFTNRACTPLQKTRKVTNPYTGEVTKETIFNPETDMFEMTDPKCQFLMQKHWDVIICDEAHRLKNPDAQWTRNIKKLQPTSAYKHIMTGTGFINNPSEVWSLLNFVWPKGMPAGACMDPTLSRSNDRFSEHFCEFEWDNGFKKIVGINPDNADEFRRLIRNVGVRRTMLECFPNITEPIESVIPVELSAVQQRMYEGIMNELYALDQQGVPLHSPTVLSALNRLRQICVATPEVTRDEYDAKQDRRVIEVKLTEPSSKLDACMEVIEGLEWDAELKDQVVVFSNFRQPLYMLKERLIKAKIPHLHMVSEMNDKARYDMWHEKWPTKQHQVFLSTLDLGAESINLASAQRAIFLDQHWSPAKNAQAIGRIYRPGQTGACQLIYIRAEGTVDYRVLDSVNTKLSWFAQIFGADQTELDNTDDQIEDENA